MINKLLLLDEVSFSSLFFLMRGEINADLNPHEDGKQPSSNDNVATCQSGSVVADFFIIEIINESITDDFADMAEMDLMTSFIDGEWK